MNQQHSTPAMALSERLYKFCLRAYPRDFRAEYANEMSLFFRDALRERTHQKGTLGVVHLWCLMLADLVTSVCAQRIEHWLRQGAYTLTLAGKEQLLMPFTLEVAQRTDIGRARANNEDNLLAVVPDDQRLLHARGALFVVSDGMGGHAHGEIASELAVQRVKDAYYRELQDDIPTALRKAITEANVTIYQASSVEQARDPGEFSMGATCVAAVLHEGTLYAANVGDSRVYVLRDGQLRQITRDHSLIAQLVERGELTPTEARTHERRNLIYRSLGQPDVEVDLFTETVGEGDTLILCTDGLCGVLEDEELRAIVEGYGPEESVEQLIAHANAAGGPDNVTAIVVRLSAG